MELINFGIGSFQDKSLESKNYFFIFGGGTRQCPGKELGIAEISTFLHYFVTKYRYLHPISTFSVWFSRKSRRKKIKRGFFFSSLFESVFIVLGEQVTKVNGMRVLWCGF